MATQMGGFDDWSDIDGHTCMLVVGLYTLISYGSALMQATMQATFLLAPVESGGYGLELIQLAEG